ncbi:MAG: hypothetical protein IH986_15775, partial [Planctomycetes bacterium]|nr:hypothetical protein [Planctomycetota bacterium]
CARLGIAVIPPDVNASGANFSLEDGEAGEGVEKAIRFGLRQIKNVGAGAAENTKTMPQRRPRTKRIGDFMFLAFYDRTEPGRYHCSGRCEGRMQLRQSSPAGRAACPNSACRAVQVTRRRRRAGYR